MTQADDQWLGRGGQGVDSVRVGVLLVSRRHPCCFLVPVIMQRQILAVLRQDTVKVCRFSSPTSVSIRRFYSVVNRDRYPSAVQFLDKVGMGSGSCSTLTRFLRCLWPCRGRFRLLSGCQRKPWKNSTFFLRVHARAVSGSHSPRCICVSLRLLLEELRGYCVTIVPAPFALEIWSCGGFSAHLAPFFALRPLGR